jgi:multidrug resistance efflux pump
MFKKTPSSIDDYRAEFDQAQAEIFAADTEIRRLEAQPTSRADTVGMFTDLINAEADALPFAAGRVSARMLAERAAASWWPAGG